MIRDWRSLDLTLETLERDSNTNTYGCATIKEVRSRMEKLFIYLLDLGEEHREVVSNCLNILHGTPELAIDSKDEVGGPEGEK